ncbi:MAG: glycosyltransferase [Thermoplasmata archaeon]
MKILVVPTTDWLGHPVPNRLNFVFDRLAKKHEIDVCEFKIFNKPIRETNCKLIEMDKDSDRRRGVKSYYLKRSLSHWKKIAEISGGYDVIISSNIIPSSILNVLSTPFIIDYLDHLPESASAYYHPPLDHLVHLTADHLMDLQIKKAKGLITTTSRFKDFLQDKTESPIEVVHNGVDCSLLYPVKDKSIKEEYRLTRPVIGYVGSLEKWIDLEHIISMFPWIIDRYKKATLFIVGPSLHTNYVEDLKGLIEDHDIQNNVVFSGGISYENLAPYISAMDVGLNPRKPWAMNEYTMGSKVLNYLACGVPVLTTNMPVVNELFSKDDGVFPYENDEEFMGELHRALSLKVDPSRVEKFDWNRIASDYERAIYHTLE